ncbi:MAG: ATP-binding protein [Marinifilaceae bacterium]|jgi:hypothetical protein|nr:ATP-binding protein [Marinifilaceae bacterium]
MAENLEFKISSGLKNIIGRDLITDDFIAVFELVKNSYDAYAKNVDIVINENEIIIADNGNGMTLSDLKDKWLFVAYSEKKDGVPEGEDEKKESYRDKIQKKRHVAGSKGIGRFSSDRLGGKLSIITRKKSQNNIEQIKVDWSRFEKDQRDVFEKIKVEHKSLSTPEIVFPNSVPHGTILKITNLHSHWDRKRLKTLKHSLEKLINPFSETNDFEIKIICEKELKEDNRVDEKKQYIHIKRDRINGTVNNSILEILNLKTTQLSVEISSSEIETKIVDRGSLIYHIKENNKEYKLLENVKIDLYFLNTSAKYNFTRKMGIQVVNFGSVFLFKNGFRVQPYGDLGDDSWGLDQRKQQGYNRFLGTRDLFGRVDVISDNTEQFKEVSSRDGGLVESDAFFQLMHAFKEKGLVRLERYVVGVLWGEGFKKRKYFGEGKEGDEIADKYRKELSDFDKSSDDVTHATSNLGSKLDFIQIIKSLATDDNITIINYNRDFVNLVNENIDDHQTRFISDLEKIAEITDDEELKSQILRTEEQYQELKRENDIAKKKQEEERLRRIEAEKKAEEAENRRIQEERRRIEEEERRRKAELDTAKKEKERALAELAKFKAQKKAKEEEDARKKAEIDAKLSRKTAKNVKKQLVVEEKRRLFSEAQNSLDIEHVLGITHQTGLLAGTLFKDFNWVLQQYKSDNSSVSIEECIDEIERSIFIIEKIQQLSNFATRANFDVTSNWIENEDLGLFICDYIKQVSNAGRKIKLKENIETPFIKNFRPIEISMVVDNAINNAQKAGAKNINIEINSEPNYLSILILNDGKKLTDKYNPKDLLKKGITTTSGSGLGLYHINKIITDLKGKVTISNTNQGTLLKIEITK